MRQDLTGRVFGRLTVVEFSYSKNRRAYWVCKCSCGKTKDVGATKLTTGRTKSCGCYAIDIRRQTKRTHGHTTNGKVSSEYASWSTMIARCTNPKNHKWARYGARGIKVCKRWHKFDNFLADMGLKPNPTLTLERKNVNGNYCKSNCRWATHIDQARNKINNRLLTWKNQTKTLAEWSEILNVNYSSLRGRINKWGHEYVFNQIENNLPRHPRTR